MKTSNKFFKISYLLTLLVALLPSLANAYTYNIKLSPATDLANNFVGRFGFFASDNVQADYKKPKYNFTFLDNMILAIDNVTGNATVKGTMVNNANSNDTWSFDLNLNGLVFKDQNGQFFNGATRPYDQMINDILAIPSMNQPNGQGGYGIEWRTSQLTIRDNNSSSAFNGPLTYTGKNDPANHHINVAELHNWNGRLYFNAWWMATSNPAWFADTKSWGTYLGFNPPPGGGGGNPIPEPATLSLLTLAGLGAIRRRRSA